jgi:alpha-2-macroglobulin
VKVPDTITTWVANGFAMSPQTGLGVADTTSLKAFQPFFIQMTLPYSVIRGEEIPVIVTVFNYVDGCAPVRLKTSAVTPVKNSQVCRFWKREERENFLTS